MSGGSTGALGGLGHRRERRDRHSDLVRAVLGAAHRDAHLALLDRDLADSRLLHEVDQLADAVGPRLLDATRLQGLLASRTRAHGAQEQLLGRLAEQGEQQELLLARCDALGGLAHVVEPDRP